uniref:CHAT domain-containing protein n=1 Tax=Candidatus Kentrum sp. FW TaxID=2126338 RepID=A0A450SHH4_9GAMM|nr:MAG: CHAT domain-containing protein [Candidatus Kentron sp. FW]
MKQTGRNSLLLGKRLLAVIGLCVSMSSLGLEERHAQIDMSNGSAVMDAARAESNQSCASPRARELFARASSLGESYADLYLAWSYDPLRCDEPGTDPEKAAELYRTFADRKAVSGSDNAVNAWIRLVEQGLASPAPFSSVPALLTHYGETLLEHSNSEALGFLKRAFIAGEERASQVLRRAMAVPNSHDTEKQDTWSSYKRESERKEAACTLGEALMARFPDGERENEAIDTLRQCSFKLSLAEIFMKRLKENRAEETDQIWLLRWLPEQSNWFSEKKTQTLEKLVSNLSMSSASDEARETVAEYLYQRAQGDIYGVNMLADWQRLVENLEHALQVDPSDTRLARHADGLYVAVLYLRSENPSDDLQKARALALRRAAVNYAEDVESLNPRQLARLAVLSWHGFSSDSSADTTRRLFQMLADRGDVAAQHTMVLHKEFPTLFETSHVDFIRHIDNLTKSRSGVCSQGNLASAINVQTSLYARLSERRGFPNVAREVAGHGVNGQSLYSMIPPRSAVALFTRDDLASCVWLLGQKPEPLFAAIYLPSDFVRNRIAEFLYAEQIDEMRKSRVPIPRGVKVQLQPAAHVEKGPALQVLPYALFPGPITDRLKELAALTVVPFGDIGTIPFAAMPFPGTDIAMLDRMSISIAPNIVDLFAAGYTKPKQDSRRYSRWRHSEGFAREIPGCENKDQGAWRRHVFEDFQADNRVPIEAALIVGDPDFSQEPEFIMPQLPGARIEAKDVARQLGAKPLIGKKATLATVTEAASQSDLLYFASHGIAFEKSGLDGFIALANAGRLSARNVQMLCLKRARLTVLSACQTGLGQSVGGGVIGLARAFQIAGVPNVVMSLWNVDDEATRTLMTRFMSEIQKGAPTPEALRTAMRFVRETKPEPRYWASFTVFSEMLNGR